ncbi:ABC transporter ATP-binding protein [Acetivibrio cellulolyticus]|uniref:ABC transporter ATP-binding protein n=1 Tax=Acetivibrio cellulolyticus TaxID=35830 RepID=UPI0001E30517
MLTVKDLSISFTQYEKGMRQKNMRVISNLNITIKPGKILAIVGSSGSGKSLLAHAILGILPQNAKVTGSIKYKGEELTQKLQNKLRGNEITLIPQSVNYLDPLMKVGAQVRSSRDKDALEKQSSVFNRYSLHSKVGSLFPFQLSGGMARRVLVASAVVGGAKLIIADEPTPGLHPDVVKETLGHLRELADEGCGVMLITHDIGTAVNVADDIAVFYAGTTIEVAPVSNFTEKGELLRHPYTKALWNALPQNEFTAITGFQPSHSKIHGGCLFHPRCTTKSQECMEKQPEMRELRNGRVRCNHAT